jgi:hypothetical protein
MALRQGSVGACLFEVTLRKMTDNVFRDDLGEDLLREYLRTSTFPPSALRMIIPERLIPLARQKDQVHLYLSGRYHTAWTDRREVEKNSEATLVLKPKP